MIINNGNISQFYDPHTLTPSDQRLILITLHSGSPNDYNRHYIIMVDQYLIEQQYILRHKYVHEQKRFILIIGSRFIQR